MRAALTSTRFDTTLATWTGAPPAATSTPAGQQHRNAECYNWKAPAVGVPMDEIRTPAGTDGRPADLATSRDDRECSLDVLHVLKLHAGSMTRLRVSRMAARLD